MARMKRWEAVRQRLADANGHGGNAVSEVVDAVADVVGHHEGMTVTVTVDDGRELATVRIVRQQGQLEVTHLQPAPPLPPPRDMPWAGKPVNQPFRSNWQGPDHSNVQAPDHSNAQGPDHTNAQGPDHSNAQGPDHSNAPGPDHSNWQGPDPETLDQTAARLAELIRQDPSLLDGNP